MMSYMSFDISGDKTSNNPQQCRASDSFTDETGKYYYFNCYIRSIEMANNMLADEQQSENDDYYSVVVRNLINAIKDYGHYAQLMLSAYHGWEISRDYAPIENANIYVSSDTASDLTGYSVIQRW